MKTSHVGKKNHLKYIGMTEKGGTSTSLTKTILYLPTALSPSGSNGWAEILVPTFATLEWAELEWRNDWDLRREEGTLIFLSQHNYLSDLIFLCVIILLIANVFPFFKESQKKLWKKTFTTKNHWNYSYCKKP